MKYFVTIAGQTFDVEVDGTRVLVGGVALEANLVAVPGTPLRHLLVGGESWTLAADPAAGPRRWTSAPGRSRRSPASDPARPAAAPSWRRCPASSSGSRWRPASPSQPAPA